MAKNVYVTVMEGVGSVNGKTGVVTVDKNDVGLGNVDNTADSAKSVSHAATAASASSGSALEEALKNVRDITYANLITARNAGTLIAGSYYRITDFRSIYRNNDSEVCGRVGDVVESPVEPLIVLAIASNKISSQAFSEAWPTDVINYDPDLTYVDGTATAMGFITYRWEPNANVECYYDWRNIKFKRWTVKRDEVDNVIPDWVSGQAYTIGDRVYNPADNIIYMCLFGNSDTNINVTSANWVAVWDGRAKISTTLTIPYISTAGGVSMASTFYKSSTGTYHYTFENYDGTPFVLGYNVQNVRIERANNSSAIINDYSRHLPNNVFICYKDLAPVNRMPVRFVNLMSGTSGCTFNAVGSTTSISYITVLQSTNFHVCNFAANFELAPACNNNVVYGTTIALQSPSNIRMLPSCISNLFSGKVNFFTMGDTCTNNVFRSTTGSTMTGITFGRAFSYNVLAICSTATIVVTNLDFGIGISKMTLRIPSSGLYGASFGDRLTSSQELGNNVVNLDLSTSTSLFNTNYKNKYLFRRGDAFPADVRLQYYAGGTDTPTTVQANI
jgi:hypothetical protein